jgi:hypothetical protein
MHGCMSMRVAVFRMDCQILATCIAGSEMCIADVDAGQVGDAGAKSAMHGAKFVDARLRILAVHRPVFPASPSWPCIQLVDARPGYPRRASPSAMREKNLQKVSHRPWRRASTSAMRRLRRGDVHLRADVHPGRRCTAT